MAKNFNTKLPTFYHERIYNVMIDKLKVVMSNPEKKIIGMLLKYHIITHCSPLSLGHILMTSSRSIIVLTTVHAPIGIAIGM